MIRPFSGQNFFTVFNNYILDHIMPDLSPNAWKCLCFIIRKTTGWHKDEDMISFSQIRAGTGIKSNHTVAAALAELETKEYILITRDGESSNVYRLNTDLEIDTRSAPPPEPSTEKPSMDGGGSAKNALGGSAKNALGGSAKNALTKDSGLKETTTIKENGRRSFSSDDLRTIAGEYENEIGFITPHTSEIIKDWLQTYPPGWIVAAIKTAVENNVRKSKYISAILANWQRDGRDDGNRKKPNGNTPPGWSDELAEAYRKMENSQ